jgi:hypothetical protein
MSRQIAAPTGTTEWDMELRARLVTDLAQQVQDYNPLDVFDHLTALSAAELQRLLMVALAGLPLERTLTEMFRWVVDLPVAKAVTA